MTSKTCRMCDKIEPRGCGKTCCAIDGHVIMSFDDECKCSDVEVVKDEEESR